MKYLFSNPCLFPNCVWGKEIKFARTIWPYNNFTIINVFGMNWRFDVLRFVLYVQWESIGNNPNLTKLNVYLQGQILFQIFWKRNRHINRYTQLQHFIIAKYITTETINYVKCNLKTPEPTKQTCRCILRKSTVMLERNLSSWHYVCKCHFLAGIFKLSFVMYGMRLLHASNISVSYTHLTLPTNREV